jgi:N-acetylneuraminate synthase
MDPKSWREMVDRTRELEYALGTGAKQVEDNERETVVLQRRCVRAAAPIIKGTALTEDHMTMLRPCPADAIPPYQARSLAGKRVRRNIPLGEHLRWIDLE